jgi:hypothetical protein
LTKTQKWKLISDKLLPSPRAFHASLYLNGQLFIYGGSNGGDQYFDELLKVDFGSGKVFELAHSEQGGAEGAGLQIIDGL